MDERLLRRFFEIIPDAQTGCAADGCSKLAAKENFVIRQGLVFHSEKCADITCAVLVKPQPVGFKAVSTNGQIWDV